jgi:hypothetical protein
VRERNHDRIQLVPAPAAMVLRFASGEVHNVLVSLGLPGPVSLSAVPLPWGVVIILFLWRAPRAATPAIMERLG